MKIGHNVYCDACLDLIPMDSNGGMIEDQHYCEGCFNELAWGIIDPAPTILALDGPQLRHSREEAGPWQEHAIRCLEEARAE